MDKQKENLSDSQLHWFWRLTTKWWFFPAFYVFLAFIFATIKAMDEVSSISFSEIFGGFVGALIYMPGGLVYWVHKLISTDDYVFFAGILSYLFHPLVIILIIAIQYFKYKKNKIIKWLVITLFFLIVLAFSGCVTAQLTGLSATRFIT